MRKHKEEEEVIEAISLKAKSAERKNIWTELVRRGDHNYNIEALQQNKEER